MCLISAIHTGLQQVPLEQWDRPKFDQLQDILRRIEKLDEALAQPDCLDPAKAEMLKRIEERLTALEQKFAQRSASPNRSAAELLADLARKRQGNVP